MMNPILENSVAIVTGANQGLGLEISKRYLEAGASLMICARGAAQLESARLILEKMARPGQSVEAVVADISNKEEVSALVELTLCKFGRLDVLVNNAGVYGPKGGIEDVDWDDWLQAIEINLFGSILMCKAVLPHFKSVRSGKIVQLSGGGATNPLPMLSAYAVSKAAIIRFVETLAEEVRSWNIGVNAIAPGALNTRMLDEILQAGPDKVGKAFYDRSLVQKENGGAPLGRGADLAVFLGSPLSNGITGKLLSAVWDPWEKLSAHLEDMRGTDIYTLRRIVPKDRGMSWGEEN